ncbi:hypothetical protein F0344_24610 [Streptomyces finlayi]|uniref:ABC transporter permease n=1 Tax=Streptomyces finlayi TaxID=67296 RepID=A0A7G7BPT7_9ACTN|nr:hypothetical protein [Streptomyces finlayi]QNE77352.1 hypothetical protein F0344_24610 [Streptomyces finlayi]
MSRSRRGATAQLLAIGRRTAHAPGDPRALLQSACLALAAAATVLLVWSMLTVHAVYDARDARGAARMPVLTDPGSEPALRWLESQDSRRQRGFSVVYIEPVVADAPLPPGLPRWPAPGEAFVSPALLEVMPQATTRYGAYGGKISAAGLADPGELLVYARAPEGIRLGDFGAHSIPGFGSPQGAPEYFSSQGGARSESDLYWLISPFLVLPVAVLLVTASRLDAKRRDRRLAALHALGAGRSVRARISVGECARPLALGAAAAALPLTALVFVDTRLPITDYWIAADDLRPVLIRFLLLVPVVWVALCALFAGLHLRPRGTGGNRPRPLTDRAALWPGWLSGAGGLLMLWGALVSGASGYRLFVLGTLLALAGLPPLLGRAAVRLSSRLTGRGRDNPARLIGGRWAAAHPGVVTRAAASLAVLLGLLAQAQVAVTDMTAEARAATALGQRLDGRMLQVDTAEQSRAAGLRFTAGLDPGDLLLRVGEGEGGQLVVEAPCATFARLGALRTCPRDTARALEDVFARGTPRTEALRWMTNGDPRLLATPDVPELLTSTGQFAVLMTDPHEDRVERAARAAFGPVSVATPGEAYVTGSAIRARTVDWVLLTGSIGLSLLVLTGLAGLLHGFLDRAEDLGPLAGYTAGVRFHVRLAWWGMGAPMACAAVLSILFAGLIATLLSQLFAQAGDTPQVLLGVTLAGTAALCGAATVVGGLLSRRYGRRWVPGGD